MTGVRTLVSDSVPRNFPVQVLRLPFLRSHSTIRNPSGICSTGTPVVATQSNPLPEFRPEVRTGTHVYVCEGSVNEHPWGRDRTVRLLCPRSTCGCLSPEPHCNTLIINGLWGRVLEVSSDDSRRVREVTLEKKFWRTTYL